MKFERCCAYYVKCNTSNSFIKLTEQTNCNSKLREGQILNYFWENINFYKKIWKNATYISE